MVNKLKKKYKIILSLLVLCVLLIPFIFQLNIWLNNLLKERANVKTEGIYYNKNDNGFTVSSAGARVGDYGCYSLIYFTVNNKIFEVRNKYINLPYGKKFIVLYNKHCPEFNRIFLPDSLKKHECHSNNCVECYIRENGKSPEYYVKPGNAIPFKWIYLFFE